MKNSGLEIIRIVGLLCSSIVRIRMLNIVLHAGKATAGEIIQVTQIDKFIVANDMKDYHDKGLYQSDIVWKRVRDYYVAPEYMGFVQHVINYAREHNQVLRDDIECYDTHKANNTLVSVSERNYVIRKHGRNQITA